MRVIHLFPSFFRADAQCDRNGKNLKSTKANMRDNVAKCQRGMQAMRGKLSKYEKRKKKKKSKGKLWQISGKFREIERISPNGR